MAHCNRTPLVDLSECTRCGVCVDVAPEIFRLEAGFVQVTEMACYPETAVEEAIRNCPADCIQWEDRQ